MASYFIFERNLPTITPACRVLEGIASGRALELSGAGVQVLEGS